MFTRLDSPVNEIGKAAMQLFVGSDHAGFHLKNRLRDWLRAAGHEVTDLGVDHQSSSDYPEYGAKVAKAVVAQPGSLGILICGTGAGISIAANKVHGARATACSEPVTARLTRSHNDANIVCIGERIVGPEMAESIVSAFIETPFSHGERHIRRIDQLTSLETP